MRLINKDYLMERAQAVVEARRREIRELRIKSEYAREANAPRRVQELETEIERMTEEMDRAARLTRRN